MPLEAGESTKLGVAVSASLIGAEPVYERMSGWASPTKGVTDFDQLPAEAQRYVKRLEDVSGVDCAIISTGSDRRETIIKKGSAVERWLA